MNFLLYRCLRININLLNDVDFINKLLGNLLFRYLDSILRQINFNIMDLFSYSHVRLYEFLYKWGKEVVNI